MKKTKDCAHEYLYPLDKLMHEDEIDKNLKMQCKKCKTVLYLVESINGQIYKN